ncbi:MAG: hypothetical protein MZV70_05525 [Desulfobacterales bacterium]|nr:hypothetical protein [Desulfobacterales bacterium]
MLLFLSNYLLSSQGDRMAMAHAVELQSALSRPPSHRVRGAHPVGPQDLRRTRNTS